jgi:Asp-tRNA(Asn)/Glu-tRNA(Gln) amidotransferase A subunit family amidase
MPRPSVIRASMNRRELLSGIALTAGAYCMNANTGALDRLEDWWRASRAARQPALALTLQRIRRMDSAIHAWVQVLPQPEIANGPLAGIPFGVKDVIETKSLVTEYGSPIYKGRHGSADAAIVQQLRGLGGVLVGKTQAAAFAFRTPPPTRNPRNLEHTPGGSSSGSAAAVAANMIPLAIGTQTLGSVLRPASYCGVTGFKPTYGLLSMEGVLPLAHSLDTLGFFTHTPAGMLLLWEALGQPVGVEEEFALGAPEPLPDVEPEMAKAFQAASARLRSRGLVVQPVPVTPMLAKLAAETRVVEHYEGARFHAERYQQYGARLLDLADLVREGLQIPDQRYQDALAFISQSKEEIAEQYRSTPVILAPAATGPAPKGLSSTGDSRMNAPWTALGAPAISIPMPAGSGLPLGLQLTAAHGQDARVLRTAQRVASLLG